jgi:hypothetical protein
MPRNRMKTQGVRNAPRLAPSVFHPYRSPRVRPAVRVLVTTPRVRMGSDMPMRVVGTTRVRKWSRPAVAGAS